ncbi:hypothetical protein CWR48_15555 [Oceanobacillus arenosus]|uniref:Uncharacterized protein n=1 Tax=Oceanobacillus arenosus TaxID=1229153 RepID=A0A3D8PP60_9BACI|nr:hypothetical protein [Oceanobacillus arenosus]RDW17018.1 hypothetical protein CWR48_15555 [Oceanobacillus arenosus]
MEITLKIEAPGLEGAIHTLAQVLANYEMPVNIDGGQAAAIIEAQPAQQAPVQQAPQQPVQQQAPVQQPEPIQQTPVQHPVPVAQQAPVQQAVPTTNPVYTIDQLAVAATQLMDAGKRDELIGLLGQFNVQALTALPQEQFGAFATRLRELGAKL